MTVSSTVRQAGPFVGDALTTVFPFGFKCFSKTDLVVTLTVIASGLQTTLLVDSDYTVALNADQDATPGGSITYNPLGVPMPATNNLTITSAVPQSQTVTLTIGGGFFPTVISTALDRVVILIQELTLKIARGLSVAIGDTTPSSLPSAAARALKFLAFDASGNPIASAGGASSPVSAAMAPVVSAATLAAGRLAIASGKVAARAANAILTAADCGALINATGSFSQTITAAATLGNGWYCQYKNTGTGVITFSDTISGDANGTLNPGDSATFYSDGAALKVTDLCKKPTRQVFTANGTYTRPAWLKDADAYVKAGGGSGGSSTLGQGRGGGGGEGEEAWKHVSAATIGASQTVTVGAGGVAQAANTNANGNTGGTTSFGAIVTAIGGAGGTSGNSGGAGGAGGTGGAGADYALPGAPGSPGSDATAAVCGLHATGGGKGGATNDAQAARANSGGGGGPGFNGSVSGVGGTGVCVVNENY